MAFSPRSFGSRVVHGGERPRYAGQPAAADAIPVAGPIHPSVSYTYQDTRDLDAALGGDAARYVYHRYGNPTVRAFETAIADLEALDLPAPEAGSIVAFATGSGMAAIQLAVMAAGVRQDTAMAVARDCYGATYALACNLQKTWGVRTFFLDTTDLAEVERVLDGERPRLLMAETISNPLLKVTDIPALAALCRRYAVRLIVDNTFATPFLYRPLAAGVDFVVHSTTKYIGGHGDVMGGVVVARAADRESLWEQLKTTGATQGPQEAWLLARGLKTLALRMERQCANAARVADWLAGQPAVSRVYFPGRPDHPQHRLAGRLLGGEYYGAMVAFDLERGSREQVFAFFERLQMIQPATSLGDVYSLILYPAHSSHRALTPEQRAAVGIGDGLVRLSVGIEDVADIIADLEQAIPVNWV